MNDEGLSIEQMAESLENQAVLKTIARDARRWDSSISGNATMARIDGEAYGLRAAAKFLRENAPEAGDMSTADGLGGDHEYGSQSWEREQ